MIFNIYIVNYGQLNFQLGINAAINSPGAIQGLGQQAEGRIGMVDRAALPVARLGLPPSERN